VKVLCKHFGFRVARRRGSHVVLKKNGVGTVVPIHKELKRGTLKGLLELGKIDEKEFRKFL